MTTITIQGFIHTKKEIWDEEPTYHFFTMADFSEHGYMNVCPHTITFELPKDFNIVTAEVNVLEKQKDKLADEYHGKIRQINDRIQSLLCIGHTVEVDDGPN